MASACGIFVVTFDISLVFARFQKLPMISRTTLSCAYRLSCTCSL